ncbi:glycosyltransferase family 25 protein [Pedobacter jejuensis]|uniref:Glycosyltransferase family 25 protein n=1 Tax=Pedobacter jejuensis TaxID=1268550 RepID=A0A3N0BPZ5_9SPHI|nr:glycosyltransferase family 25 protein [Pedobacter jejuensis]RNL51128.1 glycosyltransferase family 25 protein [Pedobacter jejuensis]
MLSDFDQIYLINLKRRPDRLSQWFLDNGHLSKNLKNFQIFDAIDGKNADLTDWRFGAGAYGCMMSHLGVLEDAKKNNYQTILVLEDDFIFNTNFETEFLLGMQELPSNWHMLYLFSTDFSESSRYSSALNKCCSTLSTVAYCVNSDIFDLLISALQIKAREVDVVYAHLHFLINAYKFRTNICAIFDGFSDVEDREVKSNPKPNRPLHKIVLSKLLKQIKSITKYIATK